MFNPSFRKGMSVTPQVFRNITKEKMAAPNNAYYVLTQAHAGLPNSVLFDTAFAGKTTTDLTEGTALYYTNARVKTYADTLYSVLGHIHDDRYFTETEIATNYVPYSGATQNVNLGNNNLTVGTNTLFVDVNSGNVGIGTTSPGAKLHVVRATTGVGWALKTEYQTALASGVASSFYLKTKSTGNMVDGFGGGILFSIEDDTSNENIIGTIYGLRDGADNSGVLTFNTYKAGSRSEWMRITKDGNVGIGTTSPSRPLEVSGDAANPIVRLSESANPTTRYVDIASAYYNVVRHSGSTSGFNIRTTLSSGSWGTGGGYISFSPRDSEVMRITSGGNVGIGTTGPDRQLEINTGAATGGMRLTYNDSDGSATTYSDILIDSNGDVTLSATGGDFSFSDDNLTTTGTITSGAYKVGATAGIDASFSILDGDGVTSHNFVFTKGILTSYSTS